MRRKTRQIHVGNVLIGGDAPVAVQSMTTMYTRDVDASVAQIQRLEEVGCELVRVAVPEEDRRAGARRDQEAHPHPADRRHPLRSQAGAAWPSSRAWTACASIPATCCTGTSRSSRSSRRRRRRTSPCASASTPARIDALERGPADAQGQRASGSTTAPSSRAIPSRSAAASARSWSGAWWRRRSNTAAGPTTWATTNYKVSLKSSNVLTAVEAYRKFSAA